MPVARPHAPPFITFSPRFHALNISYPSSGVLLVFLLHVIVVLLVFGLEPETPHGLYFASRTRESTDCFPEQRDSYT